MFSEWISVPCQDRVKHFRQSYFEHQNSAGKIQSEVQEGLYVNSPVKGGKERLDNGAPHGSHSGKKLRITLKMSAPRSVASENAR